MPEHIELNPVSHLTIGTVGEPGQRTFFLQGSQGTQVVSLIIEKEQAAMIGASFDQLLEELGHKAPADREEEANPVFLDMRLREPVEAVFRVGNLGLGFNEESGRVVLVAYELVEEGTEPNMVSFWITRTQARSLARHAPELVRAGRPLCGNCGEPIDLEGHFCPKRNGHVA